MKLIIKILWLILFFSFASYSQDTLTLSLKNSPKSLPFGLIENVPENRPRVSLALSGGGARGIAQIGVLKALEEGGIPIDVIVGTSMGSIIGGLYAAGYSVEQLDSIAKNTPWDNLLSVEHQTNRRDLFVDQKVTADKAIFTLRLKGFTPVLPTSINDGQKLSNYLNLLALQAPVHVRSSFDELKIKFRAVCTDLVSGNGVLISSGSLSQAMRASSSVSFFLSPVKMDSLILIDGGLVANIPAKAAAEMGCDLVIAVNTTSGLHPIDELLYPWIIADQVVSIPIKLLNETQLGDADIVIKPNLNDKLATDFTEIDSLVTAGYVSTLPYVKIIKAKLDSLFRAHLRIKKTYFKNVIRGKDNIYSPDIYASGINFIKNQYNFLRKYELKDSVSNYEILEDLRSMMEDGDCKNIQARIIRYSDHCSLNFISTPNPVINRISADGVTMLEKTEVDSILSDLIGSPYNGEKIYEKVISIINLYRNKGYSLAGIDSIAFNERTGKLILEFNEGIIHRIRIEGNFNTNKNIITREFPLSAGDYFSIKEVEQGLINLRSTNLFNDIILNVKEENNQNIVVLNVLEKISSLLRVGFRVDNENKAQISLDIRDENLFGTATELGLLLSGGARNRAYVLEHKSNRIFNTYFTYKINAFYLFDDAFFYNDIPILNENRFEREASGEYRQIYYGTSVSLGTQVERFGNLIFTGKYQVDQVKQKTGIVPEGVPYKTKIAILKVSSTIDTQDKYPYPEKGFYFKGSYETAQKILGGEVGYTNLGFDYQIYLTLDGDHTFSPKIMMGFADKTLPLSEQYSLGGQNMFYGMREDEFRGRQLFLTSLEYRYKLPFEIFFDTYFKFRYDLGSIWENQEQIRFKDLKHGIGAAFSFDTPVGPADFAVGRSFLLKKNIPNRTISWGDVFFYFSIGYYY
ncbi:MAG TPA: patatin-like phospholipase family protein [Ignavibacteriaceae bacterium]|nr:patatin-like phospholipase family protein [Ignavibacteriaceae bacterium]